MAQDWQGSTPTTDDSPSLLASHSVRAVVALVALGLLSYLLN